MSDINDLLAVHLRRLMRQRNVTKTELAHRAKVSRGTLVNIEKGAHSVSLDNFIRIATALKVTPPQLLGDILRTQRSIQVSSAELPNPEYRKEVNFILATERGEVNND